MSLMGSRLRARLQKLEATLRPKGRDFCLVHYEGDGPPFDERVAAFKIEHGVTPHDNLVAIDVTYYD
jgi:hypothetical protein